MPKGHGRCYNNRNQGHGNRCGKAGPSSQKCSGDAVQLNTQICQIANTGDVWQLLNLTQDHLSDMSIVNLSTALHRIAKHTKHGVNASSVRQDRRMMNLEKRTAQVLEDLERNDCASHGGQGCEFARCWATIAWAHASLQLRDRVIMERIGRLSTNSMESYKIFELANLLWAFAKSNIPCRSLFDTAASCIPKHLDDATTHPVTLATIAWSYATLNHKPCAMLLKQVSAAFLVRLGEAESQAIANICWALATAKIVKANVFDLLGNAAADIIHTFKIQEISNMAWALGKAGVRHDRFFEAMALLFHQDPSRCQNIHPQGVANIIWALAKQSLLLDDPDTFKCTVDLLLPCCRACLLSLKPQEFSSVLWACAKLNLTVGSSPEADALFAEAASGHWKIFLKSFSPQALTNVIQAFVMFSRGHANSGLNVYKSFIASLAQAATDRIEEFEALGLIHLLESCDATTDISSITALFVLRKVATIEMIKQCPTLEASALGRVCSILGTVPQDDTKNELVSALALRALSIGLTNLREDVLRKLMCMCRLKTEDCDLDMLHSALLIMVRPENAAQVQACRQNGRFLSTSSGSTRDSDSDGCSREERQDFEDDFWSSNAQNPLMQLQWDTAPEGQVERMQQMMMQKQVKQQPEKQPQARPHQMMQNRMLQREDEQWPGAPASGQAERPQPQQQPQHSAYMNTRLPRAHCPGQRCTPQHHPQSQSQLQQQEPVWDCQLDAPQHIRQQGLTQATWKMSMPQQVRQQQQQQEQNFHHWKQQQHQQQQQRNQMGHCYHPRFSEYQQETNQQPSSQSTQDLPASNERMEALQRQLQILEEQQARNQQELKELNQQLQQQQGQQQQQNLMNKTQMKFQQDPCHRSACQQQSYDVLHGKRSNPSPACEPQRSSQQNFQQQQQQQNLQQQQQQQNRQQQQQQQNRQQQQRQQKPMQVEVEETPPQSTWSDSCHGIPSGINGKALLSAYNLDRFFGCSGADVAPSNDSMRPGIDLAEMSLLLEAELRDEGYEDSVYGTFSEEGRIPYGESDRVVQGEWESGYDPSAFDEIIAKGAQDEGTYCDSNLTSLSGTSCRPSFDSEKAGVAGQTTFDNICWSGYEISRSGCPADQRAFHDSNASFMYEFPDQQCIVKQTFIVDLEPQVVSEETRLQPAKFFSV